MVDYFLTDEQKLKHFCAMSGVDLDVYRHGQTLKVYEGSEIMMYHYDEMGWPVFDTTALCTDIVLTEKGLRVSLINKRTYKIAKVGDVPNKLWGMEIVSHVPYHCIVEKTLKKSRSHQGAVMQSLSSGICLLSKSHPKIKKPGHIHAISMNNVERFFSPEELCYAYEQAARTR